MEKHETPPVSAEQINPVHAHGEDFERWFEKFRDKFSKVDGSKDDPFGHFDIVDFVALPILSGVTLALVVDFFLLKSRILKKIFDVLKDYGF